MPYFQRHCQHLATVSCISSIGGISQHNVMLSQQATKQRCHSEKVQKDCSYDPTSLLKNSFCQTNGKIYYEFQDNLTNMMSDKGK
jgi:hypothetical protein